jgi:alpha-L-rhamnosidase
MKRLLIPTCRLAVFCCLLLSTASLRANEVSVACLTVETLVEPVGVEVSHPRFSWNYAGDARDFHQKAWRIRVVSTPDRMESPDLWDSDWVDGAKTLNIAYAGAPLASRQGYHWQVQSKDQGGQIRTSATSFFEMGILDPADWAGAKWIARQTDAPSTVAAKVEKWTDYAIETRFRIQENCANLHFRASYVGNKGYSVQLEPGNEKNVKVFSHEGNKRTLLKDFDSPAPLLVDAWHQVLIRVAGKRFDIEIDGAVVGSVEDGRFPSGTVGVGALRQDGANGHASFDDFKVTAANQVLFSENFEDRTLNNFQDLLFVGGGRSQPRDGVLDVLGLRSLIEDKRHLESPLLRKGFTLLKPVKRARAYVCGIGYHEISINGNKVGDRWLEPGYSRYDKRVYYSVYDITPNLAAENVVGFELGRGWFGIRTPSLWGEYADPSWVTEPKLMACLKIDFTDGTSQNIVTDTSFRTAPGPILFDSIKAGEVHDARQIQPGWNRPGFKDDSWEPAKPAIAPMAKSLDSPGPNPQPQLFPPIRVIQRIPAVSVKPLGDGAYAVDFGKHMAGNAELKVSGKRGDRVLLQYAEKWDEKGVPLMHPFDPATSGCYQQDAFILAGGGTETFRPKFSYKGFRYLIVHGFPGVPRPENFTALEMHTDMRATGSFTSSNALLNAISDASFASIRSNMHSIPTDCPTFEKLGWTCDDAAPLEAMMYGFDVEALYLKRMRDFADDIRPDGAISDVVPSTWGRVGSDPAWNGSIISVAWKIHCYYGSTQILTDHYADMKRYFGWLTRQANQPGKPPHIVYPDQRRGYGDWVPPDHKGGHGPEGHSIYQTCYYYWYATLMGKIAATLGHEEDRLTYENQAVQIRDAINQRFFDAAQGTYFSVGKVAGFRQSSQILPLYFGIVPPGMESKVFANLIGDIRKRDGHFWVGILGFEYIADVLMDQGHSKMALDGHLKTDFPGLGNMINEGATTLWESYSLASTRSLNHKMFSTISEWMFRDVAGLGNDPSAPGFTRAIMAPRPCAQVLSHAKATYQSKSGTYETGWKVEKDRWILDVAVPPNTSAVVILPVQTTPSLAVKEGANPVWENNRLIDQIAGIKSIQASLRGLEISLTSGRYHFSCPLSDLLPDRAN